MVKISLRGKSVECLFGEDISIVGILGGKSDIVFLGGNSEFGGQGGFSCVRRLNKIVFFTQLI